MRALDRKLLRDLGRMKGQTIAIAVVVATAVALFVGLVAMYQSVRLSQQQYYRDARFADLWSSLSRAPRSVARDIEALPGSTPWTLASWLAPCSTCRGSTRPRRAS